MSEVKAKLPFGSDECESKTGKPEVMAVGNVTTETRTKVYFHDGAICAGFFQNGAVIGCEVIMPDICDVKVIQKDGAPKVVVVKFADGTKEKAVLDLTDTYSLEQGISICITKKLLGRNTPFGGSLYNKVIKRAVNVMNENEKMAAKLAEQYEAEVAKAAKFVEKKKARAAKIAEAKKEEAIEIQKEAYIRAIKELREEESKEVSAAMDELGKLFGQLIEESEANTQENSSNDNEQANQTVTEMNDAQK